MDISVQDSTSWLDSTEGDEATMILNACILALNLLILTTFVTLEVLALRTVRKYIEPSSKIFLIGFTVSFLTRLLNVVIRVLTETPAELK